MFTKLVKVTARFLLLFLFLFISSNPLEAAVGHMVPVNIGRKMSFSTVFHLYFSWYFYQVLFLLEKVLNVNVSPAYVSKFLFMIGLPEMDLTRRG